MKHLKFLSVTVLAVVAGMVITASALATYATSPAGVVYTGPLQGTSEGHVVFENSIAAIECEAAVEGVIESHGSQVTGKGKATKWEYTSCTNSWTIDSIATGTIEIHAAGNGIGTITSSGTMARATRFGVECVYATENTHLGTVTDSSLTGGKATLHLIGIIPRVGGSFLCGGSGIKYRGSAILNTPESIFID